MAVRRLAEVQPERFAFTPENVAWAKAQLQKFPPGRQASAVIPLLWRAQKQHDGWLPRAAIEYVAGFLDMPNIRVMEVATFYSMFNLEPVGRHFIQLCGTTPCRLGGAEELIKVCHARIGEQRHVTADGAFSWLEVECLGACCNAPMVQINDDYFEDLTAESFGKLLDDLAAGRVVKPGPQNGRVSSEPLGGPTSLVDPALFDGSVVGAWRRRFEEEASAAASAAKAPAAITDAARPADTPAVTAERRAAEGKAAAPVEPDAPERVSDAHKPVLLAAPEGGHPDDLELIWGVGPKLAAMLHGMGIFHFAQIAAWTNDNLRWVDQNLGAFKGRAVRDKWIDQAKRLASGWRPDKSIGDKPED
jgi:NADH-quinone oxidoreductase subunit E